jgi:hypothetical protein
MTIDHAAHVEMMIVANGVQPTIDHAAPVLKVTVETDHAVHALRDYLARMIVHKAVIDRAARVLRVIMEIVHAALAANHRSREMTVHAVRVLRDYHARMIVQKAVIDHAVRAANHRSREMTVRAVTHRNKEMIVHVVLAVMTQHHQKIAHVVHVPRVVSSIRRAQAATDRAAQALVRIPMIAETVRANHVLQVILLVQTRMTVPVSHAAIVPRRVGKGSRVVPAAVVHHQVDRVNRAAHASRVHNNY